VALPYDEAGSGPAIVLLHAGIADRTMWSEHLGWLADAGYRAVTVDLPGFGEAPEPPGELAPWTDVLQTMDELSIETAVLVGISHGGNVALRVAVSAPERISALVLVGARPPGQKPSAELMAVWDAEESAVERGDIDAAVAAVVDGWTLPDAPPGLRERVATMQRRAYGWQAGTPEPEQAPDPVEQDPAALTRLDVPVLVAVGDRDKPDFAEGADVLVKSLPRARRAVIPGAGHLAPLETPEAFRELLEGFLP